MDGLESRSIFEHRSESVSRKEWGRTQFLTAMRLLSSSVYHLAMYMVPFCECTRGCLYNYSMTSALANNWPQRTLSV